MDRLLQAVAYDEASPTGLVWVRPNGTKMKPGQIAGSLGKGCYQIRYEGKVYKAHRVVYTLLNGPIPEGFEVDHADTNWLNNLRGNLRLATRPEQEANKGVRKDNTAGVKGLCWVARQQRWRGEVCHHGKRITFVNRDRSLVEAWLITKRQELHGEFSRNN